MTVRLRLRFIRKVRTGTGCWLWRGARAKGYGIIKVSGNRLMQAHRLAWHIWRGAIPEGQHVLHHCDTPLCVRPDHLFLGTNVENQADKARKGRARNQHSVRAIGRAPRKATNVR